MGLGELAVLGGVLGGLLLHVLVALGLSLWAARVAATRGGLYRAARALPLLGAAAAVVGLAVTAVGLTGAFGAVAHAPASERASLLAEHISSAMNATACGVTATLALYLGSAVVSALGTWGPSRSSDAR